MLGIEVSMVSRVWGVIDFRRDNFFERGLHIANTCLTCQLNGRLPKISGLKMIGFVYFDRPEAFFDGLMGVVDMDIFFRVTHGLFLGGQIRKHTCGIQASQQFVISDQWYCFRNLENPQGCCFLQGEILLQATTCHRATMIRKVEGRSLAITTWEV